MSSHPSLSSQLDPRGQGDAHRVTALQERAARGEQMDPGEILPLTHSSHRHARGAAKRLLAFVVQKEDRGRAARLMFEACGDLDFNHPRAVLEATSLNYKENHFDRCFDLLVGEAELHTTRGQYEPALANLMQAGVIDFQRNGTRMLNDIAQIRRVVGVYERIAEKTRSIAGIAKTPKGKRRSSAAVRLRMAHVVSQLVDGSHSTSCVTETTLKYADHERFETYLFLTESLGPNNTPMPFHVCFGSTEERAPQRLRRFEQDLGVKVILPRQRDSFAGAAVDLHRQMATHHIDVAFFHASIAMPTDWLLCAWRAAPWQFDLGFGSPLYCPAVDCQFFEYAESMNRLGAIFHERNVPCQAIGSGGTDLSDVAKAAPFLREELAIPPGHLVLGTIGNHLPARMSPQFCRMVADVMRAHPNTTYLVVGPGDFAQQRTIFGKELCGDGNVGGRVLFLGHTDYSNRMTQTFDIYLNEYPTGGGVSVCAAMAASKPVICMLVGSLPEGLAGAKYVGEAHLVRPATDEAYAKRLIQLCTDKDDRIQTGQALRRRYESEFDGRKYVQELNDLVWEAVHASSDS